MKADTTVQTHNDPFELPAESTNRLTALAASALGDVDNAAALRVMILPLRRGPLLAARFVSAGSLNVEITEGVLIGDPAQAKRILGELRSLGVGVHWTTSGRATHR